MVKRQNKTTKNTPRGLRGAAAEQGRSYCCLPMVKERVFAPDVNPNRMRLILVSGKKWVNGTVLHYYFFDEPDEWASSNKEKDT
ncbi:MAG: hypothetical protein FJ088_06360, partial [Deltaproteobacteria bacterium]|nr:hypothetical protein [Deltaproteobacteria bacterium]